MAEDLFNTLMRFHREVVMPDVDGRFEALREEIGAFRSETLGRFDAIYQRFDRLEDEYQARVHWTSALRYRM